MRYRDAQNHGHVGCALDVREVDVGISAPSAVLLDSELSKQDICKARFPSAVSHSYYIPRPDDISTSSPVLSCPVLSSPISSSPHLSYPIVSHPFHSAWLKQGGRIPLSVCLFLRCFTRAHPSHLISQSLGIPYPSNPPTLPEPSNTLTKPTLPTSHFPPPSQNRTIHPIPSPPSGTQPSTPPTPRPAPSGPRSRRFSLNPGKARRPNPDSHASSSSLPRIGLRRRRRRRRRGALLVLRVARRPSALRAVSGWGEERGWGRGGGEQRCDLEGGGVS